MPFKKGAKVIVVNDSDSDLEALFYDVDMVSKGHGRGELLYFHAYWNRNL